MQRSLRLVVGREELLRRVHLVDVLPAAAVERLEERREARRSRTPRPSRAGSCRFRIDSIGRARRVLLVRQQHGRRNRDAEPRRQRVVEELVVGAPPERVVDDRRAGERRVLQVRAIERDVVRDAIDDDAVAAGSSMPHAADVARTRR